MANILNAFAQFKHINSKLTKIIFIKKLAMDQMNVRLNDLGIYDSRNK